MICAKGGYLLLMKATPIQRVTYKVSPFSQQSFGILHKEASGGLKGALFDERKRRAKGGSDL